MLPHHANYSNYSVVRNNFYQIEAEEAEQIKLQYKLTDWCTSYTARIYSGPGFQVVVDDPKFTNGASKVHILSTESHLPDDHLIELKPAADVTFAHTAGTRGKMNGVNFQMGDQAEDKKFQAEGVVSLTFTSLSTPALGTTAFDIYYNGKKIYTVKSE